MFNLEIIKDFFVKDTHIYGLIIIFIILAKRDEKLILFYIIC